MHLPNEFSEILRLNINNIPNFKNYLTEKLYLSPGLSGLFQRLSKDVERNHNIEILVKSIGWEGVRDRLLYGYLYYAQHRRFPDYVDMNLLNKINQTVDQLRSLTVNGHSREYLLAFYFEMAKLSTPHESQSLYLSEDVLEVMNMSKAKTPFVDWMYILIQHLIEFMGKEVLIDRLASGKKFNELWSEINEKERDLLLRNFLSYGHSISESDFFSRAEV